MTKKAGASGIPAFSGTVGYEFARHFSIEAKFGHLSAEDGGFTHKSNSFQILVDGLAF